MAETVRIYPKITGPKQLLSEGNVDYGYRRSDLNLSSWTPWRRAMVNFPPPDPLQPNSAGPSERDPAEEAIIAEEREGDGMGINRRGFLQGFANVGVSSLFISGISRSSAA
jgi:hypothetical protein